MDDMVFPITGTTRVLTLANVGHFVTPDGTGGGGGRSPLHVFKLPDRRDGLLPANTCDWKCFLTPGQLSDPAMRGQRSVFSKTRNFLSLQVQWVRMVT